MAAENRLRVLQLGLGARGRMWSRVVRASPLAAPAGYVDPRPEARAWAEEHCEPGIPVFADADTALPAVEADVAVVVTPPVDRVELIEALTSHGLHVLAEKPLALTMADALAVVRAAERADRMLGVVQNFRYLPATQRLRERVQGRPYGAPTYATVTYLRNRDGYAPRLNKYPLVMDQPMLIEQSIHHLDLLRYVFDVEAETVSCLTWNPPGSQYRDDACAAALIRFTGGLIAVYEGTWVSGHEALAFQWRTDFERGVVIQRDLFGDLVEGTIDEKEFRPIPLPQIEPFATDSAALLDDFLTAVQVRRPFASNGRDHLKTLALTLACVESSQTGRQVSLPDFARRHDLDLR